MPPTPFSNTTLAALVLLPLALVALLMLMWRLRRRAAIASLLRDRESMSEESARRAGATAPEADSPSSEP